MKRIRRQDAAVKGFGFGQPTILVVLKGLAEELLD